MPTPAIASGKARRCANGYSASFINDTGCPSAPERYKKFYLQSTAGILPIHR
ncbi:MAG: hypothetical protein F6K56_09485 [Moorea sp. SIO3G5]|nr:hypothetical protein [Moorena sp. SIO3G5]